MAIARKRTRGPSLPAYTAGYGAIVALLLAHFALATVDKLAADLAIVLAAAPIAWVTAKAGLPVGVAGAAITALAPIDSVQYAAAHTLGELCAIAIAGLAGCSLGYAVGRERDDARQLKAIVEARIARLNGEPGYWHSVATTRAGLYVTGFEARFIRRALIGRDPGLVADIGAGSGRLEFAITRHCQAVIATEVDGVEIRRMEEHPRVTPVVVGAAQTLPFRDASLDWIVAVEVPAVSDEPWFFAEARRTVKPGGGAIVMVYNRRSYKSAIARLLSRRRAAEGLRWANLYYRHTLSEHLTRWRSAGFSAVRSEGFYWTPTGRASNSPLVLLAGALERIFGLHLLASVSPWVMLELRKD